MCLLFTTVIGCIAGVWGLAGTFALAWRLVVLLVPANSTLNDLISPDSCRTIDSYRSRNIEIVSFFSAQ